MVDAGAFAAGVALTFAAQSVVQLYVVPLAEQRKRREQRWEQRWEQNVVELADLLAYEVTRLAGEAGSSMRVYASVVADMSTAKRLDKQEGLKRLVDEARTNQREYDALARGRVELLLDRVVAVAPDAPDAPCESSQLAACASSSTA